MGFVEAVKTCLTKYACFCGRAPRSEYWWFTLFCFIALFVAVILGGALFGKSGGMVLYWLVMLGLFLPNLGVYVRRLHDTNHSGWWIFISVIPLVGSLLLLYWMIKGSDEGDNNYGPNPLLERL